MKIVEVDLVSTTPYSQSRMHDEPKLDREQMDDYERRTWREKCSANDAGEIVIPCMALKQCLDRAAKTFAGQIPGKGKATYSKHFLSGTLCEADVPIGVAKADVDMVKIVANADGVRGSGKRVKRLFPVIPSWRGTAVFHILDDTVTIPVFEKAIKDAGQYVGIGRFRPENGGFNGKFTPAAFRWTVK